MTWAEAPVPSPVTTPRAVIDRSEVGCALAAGVSRQQVRPARSVEVEDEGGLVPEARHGIGETTRSQFGHRVQQ